MRLYTDGRFGAHDPTQAPQYYHETLCHLPLIPRFLEPSDTQHPYREYGCIWQDVDVDKDINWATGAVKGIGILCHQSTTSCFVPYNYIDSRVSLALSDSTKSSAYHQLLKIFRSRMEGLIDCLRHVNTDSFTIQVMVATAQRFWLEIVAALDYMDHCKPVMDGLKSPAI